MVNGARLIGPAIAGVVIARIGPGYCFLLDGISYIAVIIRLILMQLKPQPRFASNLRLLERIRKGFDYAFASLPIPWILILMTIFSLTTMSYTTLMPVVSTEILHGDAHTLGFLLSAAGVGALLGGAYLSNRSF